MTSTEQQTARYYLNRAVLDDANELYTVHPWFWEGARWIELLFTIAARVATVEEAAVRDMVAELDELGLLAVDDLAELPRADADGMVDTDAPAYRPLAETMTRYGLNARQSRRTATAFADAAHAVSRGFGGKIQKYLRHYGERMIAELDRHFSFTDLSEGEVHDAFIEWLQNCLAMPLSLRDADMRAFCEERGITVDALIEAADAADINLAYLDDITQPGARIAPAAEEATTPAAAAGAGG